MGTSLLKGLQRRSDCENYVFLTLLLVTFVISLLVSFLVARLFERPIRQILNRLVPEDLTGAWLLLSLKREERLRATLCLPPLYLPAHEASGDYRS